MAGGAGQGAEQPEASAAKTPEKLLKEAIPKEFKPEFKEHKAEKIEKHEAKEIKVEKLEIKDKPEKLEKHEKLEKNEVKEHKHEKIEKLEIKEHKGEFLEKTHIDKLPSKEFAEVPPVLGGDPGPLTGGSRESLEAQAASLEQAAQQIRHFIEQSDRPDTGEGALHNEPDR